jgi:hypothetical protein
MARDPISRLYERHRSFPDGKNSERHPRPPRADRAHDHREVQAPQAPEDQRAAHYHNDHPNDWVRGRGESATGKPGFDFGNSWRRANKGDTWNSGTDYPFEAAPKPFKAERNKP